MKETLFRNVVHWKNWIVLICICIQFINIQCSIQFTQYNYTFNIPWTKQKHLQKGQNRDFRTEVFEGQLLSEFLIRQPKQIGDVFKIQIIPKNYSSLISLLKDNKIEQIQTPQLKGLWFESFSWPIKKNTLFYNFENKNQEQYIVSSTSSSSSFLNQSKQFSLQNFPFYVLLSSGNIQVLERDFQFIRLQKQYIYSKSNDSQTTQMDFGEGYIYHKNGMLYIFVNQNIFSVILTQINKGNQLKRFYTLAKLNFQNVKQVVQDHFNLYVFTDLVCSQINLNDSNTILSYNQIYSSLNLKQKAFIDFEVFNKTIYLLHKHQGLIQYSPQNNKINILRIQHPQLAIQVNVYNETIFVTYLIGNQHYISEYQFVQQTKQFYMNKIYNHHSEQQVKQMLFYQNYMIVNRGSQIIVGIHSLNRFLPKQFHKQGQVIQSNSYLNQIYQIRSVGSLNLQIPRYLVVTSKNIQLTEFIPNQNFQIQQKWIKIGSQKIGSFEFDVKYIGTCKHSKFYSSQYCSLTNSIQLIVKDSMGQFIYQWWIWVCGAVGGIITIIVILTLCCKYFSKKQYQFESLVSQRNTRKNVSTLVEMTMNNSEKDGQERTETNQ